MTGWLFPELKCEHATMQILLTNDDGVFAPGLRALRKELMRLGNVTVVAPAMEQSGVAHSITLLSPLVVKQVEDVDGTTLGWKVEGSPADSVKLGICELMSRPPDLIVSGINSGSNAGINVLYSGTVAAAIEGAFFKITSIAVSLELSEHFDFPHAAQHAVRVIEKILANRPPNGSLFNVNLPAHSRGEPEASASFPWAGPLRGRVSSADRTPRADLLLDDLQPPLPPRRARDRRHQPLRRLYHRHPAPLRLDPLRHDPRSECLEMGRLKPSSLEQIMQPASSPHRLADQIDRDWVVGFRLADSCHLQSWPRRMRGRDPAAWERGPRPGPSIRPGFPLGFDEKSRASGAGRATSKPTGADHRPAHHRDSRTRARS